MSIEPDCSTQATERRLGYEGTARREESGRCRSTDGAVRADRKWDEDSHLKVDEIIGRFRTNTQLRIRKTSSRDAYELTFRRFAAYAAGKPIETGRKAERVSSIPYSLDRLQGPKGKDLLVGYIATVGDFSKRTAIAHLKKFWRKGLGLDWPLDLDDIGKLPEVRAEGVPSDESVRPWYYALEQEPNIAIRSLMRTQMTYGLRPGNQLAKLKRRNVVSQSGKLYALRAHGKEEEFKTDSWLKAWMPAKESTDLAAWFSQNPNAAPDRFIWTLGDFPREWLPIIRRRTEKGQRKGWKPRDANSALSDQDVNGIFKRFARKYNLSRLRPKDFRHWVADATERLGVREAAAAYWQGWDPRGTGRTERSHYKSNLPDEEIFAEQSSKMPGGPADCFGPRVETVGTIPTELSELLAAVAKGLMSEAEAGHRLARFARAISDTVTERV